MTEPRPRSPGRQWAIRAIRALALTAIVTMVLTTFLAMLLDLVADYGGGFRNLDERRQQDARLQAWFLDEDLEEWQLVMDVGLFVGFLLTPLPGPSGRAAFLLSTGRGVAWALALSILFFLFHDAPEYSPSNRPYTILTYVLLVLSVLVVAWTGDRARFRAPGASPPPGEGLGA